MGGGHISVCVYIYIYLERVKKWSKIVFFVLKIGPRVVLRIGPRISLVSIIVWCFGVCKKHK